MTEEQETQAILEGLKHADEEELTKVDRLARKLVSEIRMIRFERRVVPDDELPLIWG